jgi:hypothetical protein
MRKLRTLVSSDGSSCKLTVNFIVDFDPIQDHPDASSQSPDSREVANYEEYLRREVPRFVRTALETAVNNEVEPIEERLRAQIMTLIEEAQNRAFSSYRALHSSVEPSVPPTNIGIELRDWPNAILDGDSPTTLETFHHLSPPEIQPDSTTEFPEFGISLRRNETSDSGYTSNHSGSGYSSSPAGFLNERDTSSGPMIRQVHSAEARPFSDEALVMPDALPEGSWTSAAYNTDMEHFDWEAWNAE